MDADRIFEAVASEMTPFDCRRMKHEISKLAVDAGLLVADSTDELRTLALSETDLVEPS